MYYNANALHTSSRTNRKRVYHNMKNLQSDRSNFDHQKGVKIFTLEKFYTRGVNLHPQNVPMCQFSQQSVQQIFQDPADGRTSLIVHAIRVASYRSCTKTGKQVEVGLLEPLEGPVRG